MNWVKRNKNEEAGLVKSCKNCNLEKAKNIFKKLEPKCRHHWIRKDGRKITDPWEVFDDYKLYNCAKCRKEKLV